MTNTTRSHWQLHDWLVYLESIQPIKYNLRLEHVREVATRLELINLKMPVITVGGTNGKGSTVAALASLYSAGGYKVGHFTSPHLIKFNERISINNHHILDEDAAEFMLQIDNIRGDIEISYFEAALLCALMYFKKNKVDLVVLEVGMGGRLDATNIIDADVTIMSSIALDHQKYLGNDTFAIGKEKAGIMRNGKNCIFADYLRPQSIDGYAKEIGCDLICIGADYKIDVSNNKLNIYHHGFPDLHLPIPKINIQAAASAVIATNLLQKILPLSNSHLQSGMDNIVIFGRQQLILHNNQQIVLDVSHNPHGVMSLSGFIKNMSVSGRIHAIFSGLSDKDLLGMVAPFINIVDYWYPVVMQSKRAATQDLLCSVLTEALGTNHFEFYQNIEDSYKQVTSKYVKGDLIVIYGSFLLIGAFMEKFTREVNYV